MGDIAWHSNLIALLVLDVRRHKLDKGLLSGGAFAIYVTVG